MAVDQQILVAGTSAVPLSYTVPNAIEAALLCVNATIDGSAAAGSFLATVEIVSDGGVVVARCPCFTTIAAGGSAEVSWFRLKESTAQSSGQSVYAALILATGGLVLYWKLDETAGTTVNDTLSRNNGIYVNAPTLGVPPLADVHAVTFNGTTQLAGTVADLPYVDLVGVQANGQMSCEFWVKTTMAPGAGNNPAIVNSDTNGPGGRYFNIRLFGATNAVQFIIFDEAATGYNVVGATAINDGVKHYVACTFNGVTMNVYVDGVLDATFNPALGAHVLASLNHGLWVASGAPEGGGFFTDPHFAGTVDEVALYNIGLSATVVAQHETAGHSI